MTTGFVHRESWRPAEGCRPARPVQVHKRTRKGVRTLRTYLRHFGPKTFRHYVFGAEMSHIFAPAPVPKCLGQFGTKVHETLRTQN